MRLLLKKPEGILMAAKNLNIPILARVEGEGALDLEIENNKIKKLALRIFEPPRLFEKFLEGRNYYDVIDIVARICGICPVAYQMSAVHAIESIFDINPGAWAREMRRLFYCGEWLQSHSLHVHFLAAPDFLGFENVLAMAEKYPEIVKRGLKIQRIGNDIVKMFGARSVHPVGACVGGFFHAPDLNQVKELLKQLKEIEADAAELIHWTAGLPIPEFSHDILNVSLQHPNEYPFNEGNVVSSKGLNIKISEYEKYFREEHIPHSTALYSYLENKPYLTGPLARLNNNYQLLPKKILDIINEIKLRLPTNNMFDSIIARAIEIYHAILEAIRILENYRPDNPRIETIIPKSGVGYGCTEAPRGMLWHKYELDDKGLVKTARIVPPTSQNQARIEEDLTLTLNDYGLNKNDKDLRLMAEMVIRNYDPCISCSVHFLDLTVNRG